MTPRRPTQTRVEPERGCLVAEGPNGRKLYAPPRPGVSATKGGGRSVLVEIAFRELPKECVPHKLRITLDINRDGEPGDSRLYPSRAERQRVRVTWPSYRRGVPDVVAVSAVTGEGFSSKTATILISGR